VEADGWVRAADLGRLRAEGRVVAAVAGRPVVVFRVEEDGREAFFALDNRCPHMGFPLARGTVEDGTVVCHWHHARFDLRSGAAFDPWADDAPAYATRVTDGAVYVRAVPQDPRALLRRRLEDGMALGLDLVMAKAVHGLLALGAAPREVVAAAARFGAEGRDAFGPGLVVLTAMAHVAELVPGDPGALALAQGVVRAARDTQGQPPHRPRRPLGAEGHDRETLARWVRRWAAGRHRDGLERTVATLLAAGAGPREAGAAVFAAATDRVYADAGHTLDFANKAFELAEYVGWGEAPRLLAGLAPLLAEARGAEESAAWRSPVDLIARAEGAERQLPAALAEGRSARWPGPAATQALADRLLADDADRVVGSLLDAARAGAAPAELALAVAHAAARRVVRFGPSNDFGDWDTALHTFTYAQAALQAVRRAGDREAPPEVVRAVVHGALSVYQDRFLNVPPARPPAPDVVRHLPDDEDGLAHALLAACDAQGQLDRAAGVVLRYAELGRDPGRLLAALTEAVVREDAAFHTLQCLEAGLRLWQAWDGHPAGAEALMAVARYAAAHAPTPRAFLRTWRTAERLARGEALYGDEEAEAPAAR
jgi:nitrite reductase/ring-hydroxylating ferredoxin subunit